MNTIDFVRETNRIEGIHRPPTSAELAEHDRFVALLAVTIEELAAFVSVYQPDARLRDRPGLDVRVGSYYPPRGGLDIETSLRRLLNDINSHNISAWEAHCRYESLHPFTDGNGRSGRALWYWMMGDSGLATLGFLHAFYYQTLQNTQRAA